MKKLWGREVFNGLVKSLFETHPNNTPFLECERLSAREKGCCRNSPILPSDGRTDLVLYGHCCANPVACITLNMPYGINTYLPGFNACRRYNILVARG